MPTKYVTVNGIATYYHYIGATTLPDVTPDFSRGLPILMLHAAGSNGHSWHRQLEALGRRHSPVALDFPGHGRSEGVRGFDSIAEYADFSVAFADALGLRRMVVMGRSMGGAIAMEIAVRHPTRAIALVLIATAAKFTFPRERIETMAAVAKGKLPQQFETSGFSPKTVNERFEVVRESWMEQVKTDPRVRYADILACKEFDLRSDLGKITQPTLVVAGADDTITPPSDAEAICRGIGANAQLAIVADAGHNVPTEQPEELAKLVEGFLERL